MLKTDLTGWFKHVQKQMGQRIATKQVPRQIQHFQRLKKKNIRHKVRYCPVLRALLPWALYRKGQQRLPGFGGQVVVAEVQVF